MNFSGINEILLFFQRTANSASDFFKWFITPTDLFGFVGGISPLHIFGLSAILIILGFHVAHLINVIFG